MVEYFGCSGGWDYCWFGWLRGNFGVGFFRSGGVRVRKVIWEDVVGIVIWG